MSNGSFKRLKDRLAEKRAKADRLIREQKEKEKQAELDAAVSRVRDTRKHPIGSITIDNIDSLRDSFAKMSDGLLKKTVEDLNDLVSRQIFSSGAPPIVAVDTETVPPSRYNRQTSPPFDSRDQYVSIRAKLSSLCPECASVISPGDTAYWRPRGGGTLCVPCFQDVTFVGSRTTNPFTGRRSSLQPNTQHPAPTEPRPPGWPGPPPTSSGSNTPPPPTNVGTVSSAPSVFSEPAPRRLPQIYTPATTLDMKALIALEEAVKDRAEKHLTQDMETAWAKYNKLKAMALQPGSSQEGKTALRMAIHKLIDLVFT